MGGNPFGKMPGGMGSIMKAMEQTVKSAKQAAEALGQVRIEASSGGGMVRAAVTGRGDLIEIKIAPEVVDPTDVQMLEDLVSTAMRDALEKARKLRSESLTEILPQDVNIPGLF